MVSEAAETEVNLKVAAGQRRLLVGHSAVVYGLHFRHQRLVLRSPSQPMALTHADPVRSILSPALSLFSTARYAMKLCQL